MGWPLEFGHAPMTIGATQTGLGVFFFLLGGRPQGWRVNLGGMERECDQYTQCEMHKLSIGYLVCWGKVKKKENTSIYYMVQYCKAI